MAAQPFDEDRNRAGIQAMPLLGGGGSNGPSADALRRYVDAQMALSQARRNSAVQAEAGGPMARLRARNRERQLEAELASAGAGLTAAPTPPPGEKTHPTAPVDPVVSVPTQSTASAGGLPAAPTAVTDPASEISPEEQNARLRARIMLMNAGTRTGRLISTTSSQLGFRSLMGL